MNNVSIGGTRTESDSSKLGKKHTKNLIKFFLNYKNYEVSFKASFNLNYYSNY